MNLIVFILLSVLNEFSMASIESNDTYGIETEATTSKLLSRRKRYLVFPDGSSFQLVFCTQNMGYLHVGDIVWFGNTAALAWELPTDPNLFYFLKNENKLYSQRREGSKKIIYLDEDGKVLAAVPYRKKPIVNPAFAKRSVELAEERVFSKTFRKEMHKAHERKNIAHELDKLSIEFHRDGRNNFYKKLETFMEGLGWKGKECILRLLCDTAAAKKIQGSFLEEIMRATFTFPKSHLAEETHKEYDIASSGSDQCEKLYPECEWGSGSKML